MEQEERDLWKIVDVGGYAAYGTLFAFTVDAIKSKVESGEKDLQNQRDLIRTSYAKISKRFQDINLGLLDKRFPVDALRELKEDVFPEMGLKYKELDSLLKHFLSGSYQLKERILKKIKECREIIKKMGDLGIKFSKNDRYWEYRKTNPERLYLEQPPQ